jgi:hypothetical protein
MAKFQVTSFAVDSQFGVPAEKSIVANLAWEDVCKTMEGSPDAHMAYALDSLKDNGEYQFHNADGKLVQVLNHKVL